MNSVSRLVSGSCAQAPLSEPMGTRDIDSMPPATTRSSQPERTFCAAMLTASSPEAQKRLSCKPATFQSQPAASAAVLAMHEPCSPIGDTQPMTTSSTSAVSKSCLACNSLSNPESSVIGFTSCREPSFLPLPRGVRSASKSMASLMAFSSWGPVWGGFAKMRAIRILCEKNRTHREIVQMALPSMLAGRLRLPVIGSPMFIVSNPDLVIAQCKAGIVGSFPALNARPAEVLEQWIVRIKTELAAYQTANPGKKVAPFAVNQICHKSNDRLEHDVAVCVKHEVPIIITSLRPPGELVRAVQGYGGIVLHDVISMRHAVKAIGEGVDGLILVCAGAGGHAGALSPFALRHELRGGYGGGV